MKYFIVLVVTTTYVVLTNQVKSFKFRNKLDSISLKEIRVIKTSKDDYFEIPLYNCNKEFYKGLSMKQSYSLRSNRSNEIIRVTEYVFKSEGFAKESYQSASNIAKLLRKLPFGEYSPNSICSEDPNFKILFATIEGDHVYLYSSIYNFKNQSSTATIEDNLESDKNLLVDDIYYRIEKTLKK